MACGEDWQERWTWALLLIHIQLWTEPSSPAVTYLPHRNLNKDQTAIGKTVNNINHSSFVAIIIKIFFSETAWIVFCDLQWPVSQQLAVQLLCYRERVLREKVQLKLCQKERDVSSNIMSLKRGELSPFNFLTGPYKLEVGYKSESRGETAKWNCKPWKVYCSTENSFSFFVRKIIFL